MLADDVLGADFAHVGIDAVDPRRLAAGRTREVKYVGEVLCWLARKMGYLNADGSAATVALRKGKEREREREAAVAGKLATKTASSARRSPSLQSVASTGHGSSLLMHSTRSIDDSQTTVSAAEFAPALEEDVTPAGFSYRISDVSTTTMDGSDSDDTVPGPSSSRWRGTGHNDIEGPSYTSHVPRNSQRRRRAIATFSDGDDFDNGEGTDDNERMTEGEDEDGDGPSVCICPSELSPRAPVVKPVIRDSGYLEERSIDEELDEYLRHRNTSLNDSLKKGNNSASLRRSPSSRTRHYGPVSSNKPSVLMYFTYQSELLPFACTGIIKFKSKNTRTCA